MVHCKQLLSLLVIVMFVLGCRGYRSDKPPIHLNPNMDFNPKYKAQSLSLPSPDHIIPWGTLEHERNGFIDQGPLYTGRVEGKNIRKVPIAVDMQLIDRGQERFNIYCAVCHAATGNGGTPVIQRGYLPQTVFSAHWIENESFRKAVERFVDEERREIEHEIDGLMAHSPYRYAEVD